LPFTKPLSDKQLHIVAHEIPWPANYGGVFDLYHKICSLAAQGVRIHLHCFSKKPASEAAVTALKQHCVSVHIYPRKRKRHSLSLRLPYIVQSRRDARLWQRLQQDNHPVLLEGIHCCYGLYKGMLANRKVILRLHNVEHKYYQRLAEHELNFLHKTYFQLESWLLKRFERRVASLAHVLAVSETDAAYYRERLHAPNADFLPVFIPWQEPVPLSGQGSFCLYQGNLTISENERAADWLLNEVFNDLEIPFVVAGKNPSLPLQTLAHTHPHTCIVSNPSDKELQDLIRKAQINIIPSFNETGVKLKLINALFNGRYCLCNRPAIAGSALEGLCLEANTAADMKQQIRAYFQKAFPAETAGEREQVLKRMYNNEANAQRLMSWIW
jgi:glycosyltransferase involved in cell wall biosynthesis